MRIRNLSKATLALFVSSIFAYATGSAGEAAGEPIDSAYSEETSVETLEVPADPHWVFIRDVNFLNLVSGAVQVLNADNGDYLGMITTGSAAGFSLSPDNKMMFVGEGYYSRYVRGDYEEMVTFYDIATLSPVAEVPIPPKRTQSLLHHNQLATTDDGKFVLVFNLTPASSVTVVDVYNQRFVGEVESAGCAHIFPTSDRRYSMICGDGTAFTVTLSDDGTVVSQQNSERFFDPDGDPLITRGARYRDSWYYTTYNGVIHELDIAGPVAAANSSWRLQTDKEFKNGWRPGGLQPLAISEAKGLLYVLMNDAGRNSHKDSGKEVWVYSIETLEIARKIRLEEPAYSIQLSADEGALMYALNIETGHLSVYDGVSGKHIREISDFSLTPAIIHTPQ